MSQIELLLHPTSWIILITIGLGIGIGSSCDSERLAQAQAVAKAERADALSKCNAQGAEKRCQCLEALSIQYESNSKVFANKPLTKATKSCWSGLGHPKSNFVKKLGRGIIRKLAE